ncbi:hypothetical protein CM15mP35_05940 [bacterium]|nr:MAG: hypothetical protein CM15mP35_05940 [bacterium]
MFIYQYFFNKDGKLIFENGRYVKIIENKNVAVYPNKRVLRVVKISNTSLIYFMTHIY